jgi:hypothetical protein
MEDIYREGEHHGHSHAAHKGVMMGGVEGVLDFVTGSLRTIAHNKALFIGTALTLVGLLSFESGKFCDGNTADYLSCTRPSTFYFYSPLEITVVVIGVFFILIWMLNRTRHS